MSEIQILRASYNFHEISLKDSFVQEKFIRLTLEFPEKKQNNITVKSSVRRFAKLCGKGNCNGETEESGDNQLMPRAQISFHHGSTVSGSLAIYQTLDNIQNIPQIPFKDALSGSFFCFPPTFHLLLASDQHL